MRACLNTTGNPEDQDSDQTVPAKMAEEVVLVDPILMAEEVVLVEPSLVIGAGLVELPSVVSTNDNLVDNTKLDLDDDLERNRYYSTQLQEHKISTHGTATNHQ